MLPATPPALVAMLLLRTALAVFQDSPLTVPVLRLALLTISARMDFASHAMLSAVDALMSALTASTVLLDTTNADLSVSRLAILTNSLTLTL